MNRLPTFPPLIVDYWRRVFSGDTVLADDGSLLVTTNPALDRRRQVMILSRRDGTARAVLTPSLAKQAGVELDASLSLVILRSRLAAAGAELHDPDLLFYLPEDRRSVCGDRPLPTVRRLTEADQRAFDAFQAEASVQDLEDAYVELDHWAAFGCFEADRLVSVGSMYPWNEARILDLGVLTLPEVRRKGHARRVVQALSRHALKHGFEPQYRCQADNTASAALAEAAGFEVFGSWEVIRSEAINAEPGR